MIRAMKGFFPADKVMDAARGRWASLLPELGVDGGSLGGRHTRCPGCGGRDRFRFDDQGGDGTFICSQGGGGNLAGNGITLLIHVHGWDWKRAVEEVGRRVLSDAERVRRGDGETGREDDGLPKNEVAPLPDAEPVANVPKYDEAKLREFVANVPVITRASLRAASPVKTEGGCLPDFFDLLFADGERVAVFSNFFSQGDFLHVVGKGSCRLGRQRGVKAVPSDLPVRGKEGVWFLSNPVTGNWDVVNDKGERKYGRRSWQNVTTFRYAVLESDTAPEDLWLRALVKLPLPIVAMYSSGGKSIHALVRIDAGSKIKWDEIVRGKNDRTRTRGLGLIDLVCPLGADPAALTAVRLTRAPYCYREGTQPRGTAYVRYDPPRLQELIYLNPMRLDATAEWKSILARSGSAKLHGEVITR